MNKTMINSTPTLQEIKQLFELSPMTEQKEQKSDAYLSALAKEFIDDTKITTDITAEELIDQFMDTQLPESPLEFEAYSDYLAKTVVEHSIHTASPRFIGHMTTSLPYFVRPLAKLIAAMNQNVVKMETAKSFTPYERQTLAMLHRLIFNFDDKFYADHSQNERSTLGMIVSGGTIANITALWCARNKAFGPAEGFEGVEKEGLAAALNFYEYKGAVVIGSSLMHYSLEKAADILGIGTNNLIKLPANQQNRLEIDDLLQTIEACRQRQLKIIAIVGIAGTTDSGGVDPLPEMAEIARRENIHFHVDAAWGGPVLFSSRHRHKLAGIELADSAVIDGHKQLYLPMGLGALLLRDPNLATVIEKQARYIVRRGSVDLGKRSLEGSRAGNVLLLHAALNIIGRSGYELLINEGIRKTEYLADYIRSQKAFELLANPTINILLYRVIPEPLQEKAAKGTLTPLENKLINEFNTQLQKTQRQYGRTFVSRTMTNSSQYGQEQTIVALRVVLANPLTTEDDINAVLADQIAISTQLTQEANHLYQNGASKGEG